MILCRLDSGFCLQLDEKAQMMLKDLLDFDAGRIFGALTKVHFALITIIIIFLPSCSSL